MSDSGFDAPDDCDIFVPYISEKWSPRLLSATILANLGVTFVVGTFGRVQGISSTEEVERGGILHMCMEVLRLVA
jgi:hypothetical protein